jgi:hypothetical protein
MMQLHNSHHQVLHAVPAWTTRRHRWALSPYVALMGNASAKNSRRDRIPSSEVCLSAYNSAGAEDAAQAANAPAQAGRPATAQVRSKTPLFARPHRRTIPPVGSAVQTEAQRGAERFSSVPQVATAELAASAAGPVAAPPAVTPPALAPHAPVPPVAAEAIPPIRNVPPVFVPAMAPVAVPPVVAHATSAAPAVQPPSILGKLFKPAAPSTAPAGQTPATEAAPAALGSLFDRLRGNAPTPATPAPHSWLTNGPRRS